jgi:hypothetical protein
MRKLTILIVITTLVFAENTGAQVKKGSVFLGGDIAYSDENGTSSNHNNYYTGGFRFLPVFGKAIKENLILGFDLLYYYSNNDFSLDFNDLKQWIYGGGVFIRQYQQIAQTRFSLFIQGNLSAEKDKVKQAFNTPDKIETNIFSLNVSVYPGISYKISRKLQLETGFNNLVGARYFHRETVSGTINPATSSANGFNLYASLENLTRFYVGFRFIISKKESRDKQ